MTYYSFLLDTFPPYFAQNVRTCLNAQEIRDARFVREPDGASTASNLSSLHPRSPGYWSPYFTHSVSRPWLAIAPRESRSYRQGGINFILNEEPKSHAAYFAQEHGPCAAGMAFRVKDAHHAYARALELGAQPIEVPTGPMELRLPAIKGIGGAPLYLIDRYTPGNTIYDIDFEFFDGVERHPEGCGFTEIDHLTHNVYRGRMEFWAEVLRGPVQLP